MYSSDIEWICYFVLSFNPWHTTWPKVCGQLLLEHLILKSWALIWSPFVSIKASTLLGRLCTRCWNIAAGTCFHSATRVLVRLGTDVGRLGLAHSRWSYSSQRGSMGLRSGLCAGQSSYFTPILTNHFCMDLILCMGALSFWILKQERALPKLLPQSWKHRTI